MELAASRQIEQLIVRHAAPEEVRQSQSQFKSIDPIGDPRRNIRRLALDLIGLPPTPAEVDAFVNDAAANIRQFRAEARFSTWLIQITVNEALMRRRRERTAVMEVIDYRLDEESDYAPRDFADWREIPSEALERKEVRQKLAEALATLDRKYREVFVLRDMEQLNIRETAEALGISAVTVRREWRFAKAWLHNELHAA